MKENKEFAAPQEISDEALDAVTGGRLHGTYCLTDTKIIDGVCYYKYQVSVGDSPYELSQLSGMTMAELENIKVGDYIYIRAE